MLGAAPVRSPQLAVRGAGPPIRLVAESLRALAPVTAVPVVGLTLIPRTQRDYVLGTTADWFGPLNLDSSVSCCVPCDHLPIRSWPLFRARDVMRGVVEAMKAEQTDLAPEKRTPC